MSKTYLVARREFVENMRTKTFWLGVFAAPIGIVIFYAVMFLLADKTDVRKFAIYDQSQSEQLGAQWLSKEVLEKAQGKQAAEEAEEQVNELFESFFKDRPEDRKQVVDYLNGARPGKAVGAVVQRLHGKKGAELFAEFIKLQADAAKQKKKLEEEIEQAPPALTEFQEHLKPRLLKMWEKLWKQSDIDARFTQVPTPDEGEDTQKLLDKMVGEGKLFAYFMIAADPLDPDAKHQYVSNNSTDESLRKWFQGLATEVVRGKNVETLKKTKKLSDREVDSISQSFNFKNQKVSESGDRTEVTSKDKLAQFAPFIFVYILWMTVFIAANMLLTNTVEEKSNRIIEVLLSSVSPAELMNGKIFGIALTGLVIIGSWAGFLIAGIKLAPLFGPNMATKIGELGIDELAQNPAYLGSFLAYFLSGYLFYAALLVAIGSVCNSLKEAQNMMQPVTFMLFVPLATMFPITQDPNGLIAKVITYIPMYTPFAMMNRVAGPPPLWEYIASSLVILVSLWIVFKGAAKVFRVGVLMTGKPPKITEILRWMRASSD